MTTRDWAEYSSASDDEESIGQPEPMEIQTLDPQGGTRPDTRIYPIRFVDHKNTYGRLLYDIEGNPLKDIAGNILNVYTPAMKAAFDAKHLRFVHCTVEPTYAYFVTSDKQLTDFRKHRAKGATYKRLCHVYVDEDVDRNSHSYRSMFSTQFKPVPQKRG